ncbi:MAG: transglycosylase domain-containing protein, partial [Pseudomonadota bacterium]
ITQQVAKNFLLTNERSYERKIKELILSSRIEKALTKDRILELYLNQIYLGYRSYGVAAAAQTYFGKSLDEITVAEAAYLAALPKAPENYHPVRRRAAAVKRRNYVIGRMVVDGYITKQEAETAQAVPLKVVARSEYISVGAEYFVEEVRRDLLAKYGDKKMADGGYVVRSTLDPKLQQIADRALRDGLVAYDRRHGWRGPVTNLKTGPGWLDDWKKKLAAVPLPKGNGDWPLALVTKVDRKVAEIAFADGKRGRIPLAELTWAREVKSKERLGPAIKRASQVLKVGDVVLVEAVTKDKKDKPYPAGTYTLRQIPDVTGAIVAMDPHTGRVLAMTGGFSFWISQFNNATQAKRQPGSAFKPFVYLAGLDNGYTPSTIILDAPIVVKIEGLGKYKPQNFSKKFYGPTTMRRGLELSRNLMTLRLTQRIGAETVAAYGLQFGVSDHLPAHLAMALGAVETTPLRLTTAYAMLVNGGRKIKPTLIDRVQDRFGKTVFRHDTRECAKCNDATWNGQAAPVVPDLR